jgi:hypothetical protein
MQMHMPARGPFLSPGGAPSTALALLLHLLTLKLECPLLDPPLPFSVEGLETAMKLRPP